MVASLDLDSTLVDLAEDAIVSTSFQVFYLDHTATETL